MLYIVELVWNNPETHNFLVEAGSAREAEYMIWEKLISEELVCEEDRKWGAELEVRLFEIPTIESPIAELP
jgi:hypothetical protein